MKRRKTEISEDKKVYDVADVQKILGISKTKVYEYLEEVYRKQEPFKIIKIGRLYKIPKEHFDKWVSGGSYV